jgi:hypothetical protein
MVMTPPERTNHKVGHRCAAAVQRRPRTDSDLPGHAQDTDCSRVGVESRGQVVRRHRRSADPLFRPARPDCVDSRPTIAMERALPRRKPLEAGRLGTGVPVECCALRALRSISSRTDDIRRPPDCVLPVRSVAPDDSVRALGDARFGSTGRTIGVTVTGLFPRHPDIVPHGRHNPTPEACRGSACPETDASARCRLIDSAANWHVRHVPVATSALSRTDQQPKSRVE